MPRGVHGEKIVAAIEGDKTPEYDISRLRVALDKYDDWISSLKNFEADTLSDFIAGMVHLLDEYKFYGAHLRNSPKLRRLRHAA